jgi:hypothetical protein
MDMKTLKTQLGLIAAVAILAVPSAAAARSVVPPGNSAVNQYTETFPTAGGAATTKERGKRGDRSPAKVLGSDNARRLEAAAPQGGEVAAVAAATAPEVAKPDRAQRAGPSSRGEDPDGSSGLGEVIAQATGSSDSGQMGMLLPLLIFGAFVCAAIYLWRQRRRAA